MGAAKTRVARLRLRRGEVAALKVVGPGGESSRGFVWPLTVGASVEAPDWNPAPECGGGLHVWLWGVGDATSANGREDATDSVWLVVAARAAEVVDLDGKVKVPRCRVLHVAPGLGGRSECAGLLAEAAPRGTSVLWATSSAGDGDTSSAGDGGTSSAGYGGTSSAGDGGTSSAGDGGTSSAGYGGTSSAGCGGTSSAGDGGTSSAGYGGTSSAGARGLATCNRGGIVSGDVGAVLVALFERPDGGTGYAVGQVGEGGIEAGVWYEASPEGLRRVNDDDYRVRRAAQASDPSPGPGRV